MKFRFFIILLLTIFFTSIHAEVPLSITHIYNQIDSSYKTQVNIADNFIGPIYFTGNNFESLKNASIYVNLNFHSLSLTMPAQLTFLNIENASVPSVTLELDGKSLKYACGNTTLSISINDENMNELTVSKDVKIHIDCK